MSETCCSNFLESVTHIRAYMITMDNSTLLSQNTSFPEKITLFLIFWLATILRDICWCTIPKLWSDSCSGVNDRDVKPALSFSFKPKSVTFDQHSASYNTADEDICKSAVSSQSDFFLKSATSQPISLKNSWLKILIFDKDFPWDT